jgi:catechol 2,3-dioxygenase-like lactoylglutathione lyase family enzyme
VRDTGRWHLNDGQRLTVVLAVSGALFLAAMAAGMQSIVLLLIALLLVVAAGLGVFLLGLRYNGRRTAQGHAHVLAASAAPVDKIMARCDMNLLVNLPGGSSSMMKVRDPATPVIKWPRVGANLPVEVDPRNPRQVRVRWDLVEPHHTKAATPAEEAAAFAVPFFTDYADGLDLSDERPSPARSAPDPPPPALPVTLDENFPPAPGPEADPIMVDRVRDGDRDRDYPAMDDDTLSEQKALAAEYELPMRAIPAPTKPAPARPAPVKPIAIAAPPAVIPAPRAGEPATTTQRPPGGRAGMGIMLIVSDLDRSLRFYRDLLDFSVVDQAPASAVVSNGGGHVLLRQVAHMSPVDRRVVHLHIEVANLESAYEDLRAKGVAFAHKPRVMRPGDRLELWTATFRDPDGHTIALTQWRNREPDGQPR